MRRWIGMAGMAGALLGSRGAVAQVDAPALRLWKQGVADMQAGRYAEGCPAIDESQRLDPLPGALFMSATCYAQWGKPLAALQRFEAFLALAPQIEQSHGPRLQRARLEVARLRPLVPRVELVLARPAGADLSLILDGKPVPLESLGQPLAVEVGEHRVQARASGAQSWEHAATLSAGELRRIEIELLPAPPAELATNEPAPLAAPPPVSTAAQAPEPGLDAAPARRVTPLMWVAGGIGAAGILTGSLVGIAVLHQKNIRDDECDAAKQCSERGMKAIDRGHDLASIATAGFAVGAAGLLTSAALWFWQEPAPERATGWRTEIRAGSAGVWVGASQRW